MENQPLTFCRHHEVVERTIMIIVCAFDFEKVITSTGANTEICYKTGNSEASSLSDISQFNV